MIEVIIIAKRHRKEVLTGKTPREVVQEMRMESLLFEYESVEHFMEETAKRVEIYKGEPMNYNNEYTFLKELERLGLIETHNLDTF